MAKWHWDGGNFSEANLRIFWGNFQREISKKNCKNKKIKFFLRKFAKKILRKCLKKILRKFFKEFLKKVLKKISKKFRRKFQRNFPENSKNWWTFLKPTSQSLKKTFLMIVKKKSRTHKTFYRLPWWVIANQGDGS